MSLESLARILKIRRSRILFHGVLFIKIASLLTNATAYTKKNSAPVSYAELRKPRIELKYETTDNRGAVLHFYNLDMLSFSGSLESAVNCTVDGGHLEKYKEGWKRVKSVELQSSPKVEEWHSPNILGVQNKVKLQTRNTYNVSNDVEGNLTCRDSLGLGLVSNTILLRRKNFDVAIVRLTSQIALEELLQVPEDYAKYSYSKQMGRLIDFENKSNPEVLLRISYDNEVGEVDQNKLVADVTELTEHILKKRNFTIQYVRSTRSCIQVDEGNFTWPVTTVGRTVTPENFCLDSDKNPQPRRECVGGFFEGAYWDVLPERPYVCMDPDERSTLLMNITKSLNKKNYIEILLNEITNGPELSPVEVYFVSEALKKTSDEITKSPEAVAPNTSTVVSVMNSILKSGEEVVKKADESYGSSGIILESIQEILVSSASPMPTPVSLLHFSAFAATAGTGIQGFAYIPSPSPSGIGRMITFDKNNTLVNVLSLKPNVVAYLKDIEEEFGITSTLYNDGSLFTAAAPEGVKLEFPVFGMKLFQRGKEDMEKQKPVILSIQFLHEPKPRGLHCVSWEPSRDGGWSTSGCNMLLNINRKTLCICTLLTTSDMFFTLLRDERTANISKSLPRLDLLSMKNNVGSLLHVYNAGRIESSAPLENVINCSVAWNATAPEESVSLQKSAEFPYGYHNKMIIYKLSYNGDGYLQCRTNSTFASNKNLMLIQNRAILRISVPGSTDAEPIIHNYVVEHYLDFNFTRISPENETGTELYHVAQYSEKSHLDFIKTLKHIFEDLEAEYNFSLIEIQSNRLCLAHEEGGFKWPNTELGRLATPVNPCIDPDGAPTPNRRCKGDHLNGLYWDQVPPKPDPCIQPTQRAQRLHDLSTTTVKKDPLQELLDTIERGPILTVVEANILSMALKNAANDLSISDAEAPKPNITTVAKMVNAVIEAELEVKMETNTTVTSEEILDSIDRLLEKSSTDKPTPVKTSHFSAVAAAPGSKLRGFIDMHDERSANGSGIKPLSWEKSLEEVVSMPVTTGGYLLEAPEDVGVIYTVFKNDTLFTGGLDDKESQVASPVVGLKMFREDGMDLSNLPNLTVVILFPRDKASASAQRSCNYWDTKMSKWSREGCTLVHSCNLPNEIPAGMDACMCTHLTHFAMLISSAEFEEDDLLHILTIICCSVSILCLFGIFLISVISPRWRKGASKKVQLNLSASLAMLMASYLAVAFQGKCPQSIELCIALGIILHYSVLASFSWMLVAAVLQVLRLTPSMSLGTRQHAGTHLVLRASFFGWGLPLIPVAVTLAIGTDLYSRRPNSALCYPAGRALYTGVVFPVALAITVNTVVFTWLMRILFCNKFEEMRVHQKAKRRQALRRFFSAMFLFCLLGIAWISGIFVELTSNSETVSKILSYAFCATATLQGTSLFIFFVACENQVGAKMCGACSFLARKASTVGSRWGYSNRFESSGSDKMTDNTELSRIGSARNNRPDVFIM